MQVNKYRVLPLRISQNPAFLEASKEELRTLLALIEVDGDYKSDETLAAMAGVSVARCKSSLAFWEECGIISADDGTPRVRMEFDDRLVKGEIDETPSLTVAESIRDESLASMIDECAVMLGQPCLSNAEVKMITALYTQYKLSPEFIVTLAAHLLAGGKLSVRNLCNKAIKLSEKDICDVESLEKYISDKEEGSDSEWEYRRVMGIYGRNLSPSERACFKKWAEEFGYSASVIEMAYDLAVLNTKSGRGDVRYMDSVLTSWFESGCRTINQIREKIESDKIKCQAPKSAESPKKYQKTKAEAPRYGNFDIEAAFKDAVSRSFGEDED